MKSYTRNRLDPYFDHELTGERKLIPDVWTETFVELLTEPNRIEEGV
ncbi:hypothetical protein AGMMS49940_23890 [Spirochaetia bacterium]|nr:hypothetical protein AGMMS49940_23890 [Spirochaetia bacterium]